MTNLKNRWAPIRKMLVCVADKATFSNGSFKNACNKALYSADWKKEYQKSYDAAPGSQQQLCNPSDNSDSGSTLDQPAQSPPPQGLFPFMNMLSWEDREEMYKTRINDLEQELSKALKNKKALSLHLYEMGCLVFREVDSCESTCPHFVEKLKVYLECLQLERQQLEKRALWAEQTMWEIQNDVSELEKLLPNCGSHDSHMEQWFMPDDLRTPSPISSQPIRFLISKIYKKSLEKMVKAQSPEKWIVESFGKVTPQKWSPGKEALAGSPWNSPSKQGSIEAESLASPVKRAIFIEQRLPKTISHSGAGSQPEHSQHPMARASVGYGDSWLAEVLGHWRPHPERKQEALAKCAEVDYLSTTSTLLLATPSAGGSEDIKISPDPSVSLDVSPTLQTSKMENCNVRSEKQHLATVEGNCEIKRLGEGSTSKEEECIALGTSSLEPVVLACQVSENLSDSQADTQKLDNPKAETFQDVSGHAAFQTEVSFPGKNSPESGQNQSIKIVHRSNHTVDLESEEASCNLDLLQKPGKELSPLELSLKADLPSSFVKVLETNEPPVEKRVLKDVPGLNKSDQSVFMEDNAMVAFPPQLKPEELLPSEIYDSLANISLESLQPTSWMEESLQA